MNVKCELSSNISSVKMDTTSSDSSKVTRYSDKVFTNHDLIEKVLSYISIKNRFPLCLVNTHFQKRVPLALFNQYKNMNHIRIADIYFYWSKIKINSIHRPISFLINQVKLLKYLDFSNIEIHEKELSNIFETNNFNYLESLVLENCKQFNDSHLQQLSNKASSLKYLNMMGCEKITEKACQQIAKFSALISLNLKHCLKIGPKGVICIVNSCRQIRVLNLACGPEITDEVIDSVSKSCSSLEELYLNHCFRISDKSLYSLATNKLRLVALDLSSCGKITDLGIKAVVEQCTTLKQTSLWYCTNVTNEAVRKLISQCNLLEDLNLRGCAKVSEAGLDQLIANCPQLINLDLRVTCVSNMYASRLMKEKKDLLVLSSPI